MYSVTQSLSRSQDRTEIDERALEQTQSGHVMALQKCSFREETILQIAAEAFVTSVLVWISSSRFTMPSTYYTMKPYEIF